MRPALRRETSSEARRVTSHPPRLAAGRSAVVGLIVCRIGRDDVELGVGPLPGRADDGGVVVAGGGLSITARDPVKQAAGWRFVEFLTSPESQSVWAAATGYTPVRLSAVDLPELDRAWTAVPELREQARGVAFGVLKRLRLMYDRDHRAGLVMGESI